MAAEVIYFVSDLHFGDGSGADRFLYPDAFMDLLSRIEGEPGAHLVLLGDILELWASSLEGVLVAHAPIFTALARLAKTHPVTFVVGNHDCLPWYYYIGQEFKGVRIAERFVSRDGLLVALHGHQFDPFNQVEVTAEGHVKAPWVRKLVQMVGFLGRIGGAPTGEAIADLSGWLGDSVQRLEFLVPDWDEESRQKTAGLLVQTKAVLDRESPGERQYPADVRLYDEAARKLLREGPRFVVMGHTHHPGVTRYGHKAYVNTGSWVWDRYPPTYARYAGGKLELLNANTHQPYSPLAG